MKPPNDDGVVLARAAHALSTDREALFQAEAARTPASVSDYARASLAQAWSLIADLLADRNAYAEARRADAERREQEMAASNALGARLRDAETEIDRLRDDAVRHQATLDSTLADNAAAQAQHVAALAAAHGAYATSMSWRLTAPLRLTSRVLGRAR